jgi:hypothetical protein
MAGAMGAENWDWRGEQLGRYEATIETGQSIFYFGQPNLSWSAWSGATRRNSSDLP